MIPDDPQGQLDPTWSPDGTRIIFAGASSDANSAIQILDINTHKISTLPDSQGLYSPRWSPDGRYAVAMSPNPLMLRLFDFATQKWEEITKVTADLPNWSRTGDYVYFLHEGDEPSLMRVRIRDRNLERVADLKSFPQAGYFGYWLGMALDDSRFCFATPALRKSMRSIGKRHGLHFGASKLRQLTCRTFRLPCENVSRCDRQDLSEQL